MTQEQDTLKDFFKTVRELNNNDTKHLYIAAKIDEIQRNYPRASELKVEIRDDEVFILEADEKIKHILGYEAHEVNNKPLSFIVSENTVLEQIQEVQAELVLNRMCVRFDVCKTKEGEEVGVLIWIFQIGENIYREFLLPLKSVIGYAVG